MMIALVFLSEDGSPARTAQTHRQADLVLVARESGTFDAEKDRYQYRHQGNYDLDLPAVGRLLVDTIATKLGREVPPPPPDLSEDDKGIIRRAFAKHARSLRQAADECVGSLYPIVYRDEAERTAELLKKLLGPDEELLTRG